MDIDNDSLSTAFISFLDSIGFPEIDKPTHCLNQTPPDLVRVYGIDI